MNREYHQWYSHRLHRDMELLVFGHAGAKVLVFPTRCGRFYEYEEMGLVEALRHKIDQGFLQLYCVDSIDEESFYCCWNHPADRVHRHMQYESYLLHEVLPLMWAKNSILRHFPRLQFWRIPRAQPGVSPSPGVSQSGGAEWSLRSDAVG